MFQLLTDTISKFYIFLSKGWVDHIRSTNSFYLFFCTCWTVLQNLCFRPSGCQNFTPKKKKNGCLVSPQHRELSDLKILKIIATFEDLGVGYVDLKPLFKKECCLARRMEQRRAGGRRGGGSEPDQSSVCNNRSVEADDRLRQSASQAE